MPTEEEKQEMCRWIGLFAGLFAKQFLEMGGCEVNFKINGEDICDIEKMCKMDITARIKLAVQEERYEDASNLKKFLEANNRQFNSLNT